MRRVRSFLSKWNFLFGILWSGLLGGPGLKLAAAQDQVADGARHVHAGRDEEHDSPLGLELISRQEAD